MGLIMRNGVAYAGSNSIELTQAEYNALVSAGQVQPDTFYCIVDADNVLPASDVTYDNSDSGLSADNVQGAIDEVANISVRDNPAFSEASNRANIDSGESFATILGKIKKFFTDLKNVAFTGSYKDLIDKPTLGAAASYGVTTSATSGSTNLITSGGTYTALTNKSNLITAKVITKSVNCAVGWTTNQTVSCALSGYTPIMAIEDKFNGLAFAGDIETMGVGLSGTTLTFSVNNHRPAALTLTFSFKVLYVKN